MGVSPTDPGEPGPILKLDQLFRGLPAALTGIGPPAAAALQPAPQLVALGHVVPGGGAGEQVRAGPRNPPPTANLLTVGMATPR